MPTDPRLNFYFDEVDDHRSSFPVDGTINLPSLGVQGMTASTDLGAAVTLVQTGTNNPQVGKGSAGNEFIGVVKQIDLDGTASIQDRGYFLVAYAAGTAPTVNNPVGVDGAGKVQLQAGNKQAFCVGFMNDPQSGTLKCIVHRG